MNNFVRLSGLVAALCLGLPATGFSNDHGNWHGGHSSYYGAHYYGAHYYGGHCYGPHFHYGSYFPFFPPIPFIAFGGAPCYDTYYPGPSVDVSVSSPSYGGYHGARVDDHSDDLALDVQRALRHDGYYRGDIDGDIGSGTRAAIRQYQYDHHLEVTGRIDRSLLRSLDLD